MVIQLLDATSHLTRIDTLNDKFWKFEFPARWGQWQLKILAQSHKNMTSRKIDSWWEKDFYGIVPRLSIISILVHPSLQYLLSLIKTLQGDNGGRAHGLGWTLIWDVPPSCPVTQTNIPNSHLPRKNLADSEMTKIIVNTTNGGAIYLREVQQPRMQKSDTLTHRSRLARPFTRFPGERACGLANLDLHVSMSDFGIGHYCTYHYKMAVPVNINV